MKVVYRLVGYKKYLFYKKIRLLHISTAETCISYRAANISHVIVEVFLPKVNSMPSGTKDWIFSAGITRFNLLQYNYCYSCRSMKEKVQAGYHFQEKTK